MKTILISLMMVVGAAGLATGLGLGTTEPVMYFIGEDFEGNLVIREITPGAGTDDNAECGGFAPLQPDECSNGVHVRTFGLSHGFSTMPQCGTALGLPRALPSQVGRCYNGAATSQVLHATGARTFVCQIDYYPSARLGLDSISCSGTGTFPAVGAQFTHDCYSDDYGTPGAGNSGTGLGDWRCNLIH